MLKYTIGIFTAEEAKNMKPYYRFLFAKYEKRKNNTEYKPTYEINNLIELKKFL